MTTVQRKRKMLMAIPILTIPFVMLAFWSLGGGKPARNESKELSVREGLNLQLPDARLKDDKGLNKLKYYEKAARDSAKREELIKNDPYYKLKPIADADSTEEKVYERIAAIDRELNTKNAILPESRTNEIEEMEKMMQQMEQRQAAPDPELDQLDDMLDKIMDIQHPERISAELHERSMKNEEKVYAVSHFREPASISLLVSETEMSSGLETVSDSAFLSWPVIQQVQTGNAIEAVIHETRTLVNGSVVKLRLLNDVYINGTLIPKGNFFYGKVSLAGERLSIAINSIRFNQSLYPVSLSVYDMDGMDGIFIPGAITRDVAKESSERAIQGLGLASLNPSIGTQAASAGIEAAKSLLTKKVKLVKVTVKAGYKVLLKDKK